MYKVTFFIFFMDTRKLQQLLYLKNDINILENYLTMNNIVSNYCISAVTFKYKAENLEIIFNNVNEYKIYKTQVNDYFNTV